MRIKLYGEKLTTFNTIWAPTNTAVWIFVTAKIHKYLAALMFAGDPIELTVPVHRNLFPTHGGISCLWKGGSVERRKGKSKDHAPQRMVAAWAKHFQKSFQDWIEGIASFPGS